MTTKGDPRSNAGETRPDGLPKGVPFKPGNPGRPKGARNKLGEEFIKALADDFAAHGVGAIEKVRAEKPDQYLKVIASLMPKDVNLNINEAEALTDEQIIERLQKLNEFIGPLIAAGGVRDANGGIIEARAH